MKKILIVVKISFLLSLNTIVYSQDSLNTEQVYRNAIGPCYSSITMGDTLIYGEGGYIVFSDITDLNNPQEITRYLTPCYVEDFALDYPTLYVANAGYGLLVLDISDLNNISVMSELLQGAEEKEVSLLQLDDNYLYALLYGSVIQIINVSNPNSPEVVTEIEASGKYTLINDRLYQIQQDSVLVIWNVENPQSPVEIGSYVHDSLINQVVVYQNYIYIGHGSTGIYAVLDASTLSNPIFLVDISGDYMGGPIKIHNQYLLFYDPFSVYDLSSDPTNPTYINHLELSYKARHIQLNNGNAFISLFDYGLEIVDFVLPQNMVSITNIESGSAKNKVFIFENYAYIRARNFGIHIYNIETPENPSFISSFNLLNSNIEDMAFEYPYAYLAYGVNGLIILNISDPAYPIQVGTYYDYTYTSTVEKMDNYIFLNSNDFLKVIDVSDPVNPLESYSYQSGGFNKIDIKDSYAYLAQNDEGLKILDISNLNNITEVGHLYFEDRVKSVTTYNNYLYVSAMSDGFWIVNISDPTAPTLMGHYMTTSSVFEATVSENFAFLAEKRAGVTILDVSDPWTPVKVGYYNDPNSVPYVGVYENYIVAANWSAGFYIAHFDESSVGNVDDKMTNPMFYNFHPAFPNPFNPITTIRYDLPEQSHVEISIYDIMGREVKKIVNELQDVGFKSAVWDATNDLGEQVSAGMYLYRIRARNFVQVKKIVLLK